MLREASSSKPMLIATDTRKARVQGRFRNPSTKRSEVVNPTSNKPPRISQNQAIAPLSACLDEPIGSYNLAPHGSTADHRQSPRTARLHHLLRAAAGRRRNRLHLHGT